jgi:hypothetical protein
VPKSAEYWRDRAEGARIRAQAMRDPECKRVMLDVAETYETFASRERETKEQPLRKRRQARSRMIPEPTLRSTMPLPFQDGLAHLFKIGDGSVESLRNRIGVVVAGPIDHRSPFLVQLGVIALPLKGSRPGSSTAFIISPSSVHVIIPRFADAYRTKPARTQSGHDDRET